MKLKLLLGLLAVGVLAASQARADLITFSSYPLGYNDLEGESINLSFGATLTFLGNEWGTWDSDHADHTGDAANMLVQPAPGAYMSFDQLVEVPSMWVNFNNGPSDITEITVEGFNGVSPVWSTTLNWQNPPDGDTDVGWHEITAGAGLSIDNIQFATDTTHGWAPDVDDITVVPEPGAAALLLLGLSGLALRRKM